MKLTPKKKKALAIVAAVAIGGGLLLALSGKKAKAAELPAEEEEEEDEEDEGADIVLPEIPTEPPSADDVLEDLPIPDEIKDRLPRVTLPKPAPAPKPAPPVIDKKPPEVVVPEVPIVVDVPDVIQAPAPPVDAVTLEMVSALLAAESHPGWKQQLGVVRNYQRAKGLVIDGKYGPKTALRLAVDGVGTIPIVRFWPTASGVNPQAAVDSYRDGLLEVAKASQGTHAQLLRASAARETGQGFGPPQGSNGKMSITPTFQLGAASGKFGTT